MGSDVKRHQGEQRKWQGKARKQPRKEAGKDGSAVEETGLALPGKRSQD